MANTVISLRDQRTMSSEQAREKARVTVSSGSPQPGEVESRRLVVGAEVVDGRRIPLGPIGPVLVQRVDASTGEVTTVGTVSMGGERTRTDPTPVASQVTTPSSTVPRISVSSPFGLVPLPVQSHALSNTVLHLFFSLDDAARLQVPTAGADAPLELHVDGEIVRCVSGAWHCRIGEQVMYTFLVL